MATKLSSVKNIKNDLASFFLRSSRSVCRSDADVSRAMKDAFSLNSYNRMAQGVVFEIDDKLNDIADGIVQFICKAMGTLAGDEDYVSKALWAQAAEMHNSNMEVTKTVDTFLSSLENNLNTTRRYIADNCVLLLGPLVNRFDVGPVGVVSGEFIAKELRETSSGRLWNIEVGKPGWNVASSSKPTVGIGTNNWDIKVVAAQAHLAEEAGWLAGVAISLLRLTVGWTLGSFVPRTGQVEPHAFQHLANDRTAITATESGMSIGGRSRAAEYQISPETAALCAESTFKAMTGKVFTPLKNSVGERIRQSLGWQARGRQSEDRAERMLYFFTALEAMLSGRDEGAPVVQTIARNAASVLTDSPDQRARNAKLIRDLYKRRSALVHSGSREVTRRQANTIERVTENVCWCIMDRVDLAQPVDTFQAALHDASYGTAWTESSHHFLPRQSDPRSNEGGETV